MESLNDVILREIGTLSRCINYTNNLKFKKIDLQAGQFIFLTRICENQSINQTHLTALLKVDKATTAKAVQKLMQAGYVRRARDQSDRRMWRLYPTDKALAAYDFILKEENRTIDSCFRGFRKEEKRAVNRLILKMRKNVEKDWEEIRNK